MAVVLVVEMAVDQVIDMVAMRHRFMAAASAVHVGGVVTAAGVAAGAGGGIGAGDLNGVFVVMTVVGVVEMAVVEVVDVVTMLDGGMAAARAVLVGMICVCIASHVICFCLSLWLLPGLALRRRGQALRWRAPGH
jgi:hypothetical protein